MCAETLHRPPRRVRGLSIIELMVGMVVGLLVSLIAARSAQFFTATQRQGVAVGGGLSNAASALAAIKDDVSLGGMGFFVDGRYRCASLNLSSGVGTPASDGATFAPVQATRVGSNDVIDVIYSSDVAAGAWSELNAVSDGSAATINSLLPITVGQTPAVLLARKVADATAANPCLVRTVTASTVPAAGVRQAMSFANTGVHNQAVFTSSPPFTERSPVILLGGLNWNRYQLNGTNLQLTQRLTGTTATLLRNVIGLRVQYGVTLGAGTPAAVEDWVHTTDAGWGSVSTANIAQVRALRIGVVVRSPQREKPEGSGGTTCETTKTKPQLFEGADAVTIEPDVADWQCYRYRSAVIVAPIRNLVQGTSTINWPATNLTP